MIEALSRSGNDMTDPTKRAAKLRPLAIASLVAFAGLAALAPTLVEAVPHHRGHQVCHWERHHHRVCHWVR
ncbi:MAG: HHHH-motif protein [Pseudomonadota bacterium]|nr:HHHH-motif protein [Pseudomonadota bacterium]